MQKNFLQPVENWGIWWTYVITGYHIGNYEPNSIDWMEYVLDKINFWCYLCLVYEQTNCSLLRIEVMSVNQESRNQLNHEMYRWRLLIDAQLTSFSCSYGSRILAYPTNVLWPFKETVNKCWYTMYNKIGKYTEGSMWRNYQFIHIEIPYMGKFFVCNICVEILVELNFHGRW